MTDTQPKPYIGLCEYSARAAFWGTHEFTEYLDEFKPVQVRFAKHLSSPVTIQFDEETLLGIRAQARRRGVEQ